MTYTTAHDAESLIIQMRDLCSEDEPVVHCGRGFLRELMKLRRDTVDMDFGRGFLGYNHTFFGKSLVADLPGGDAQSYMAICGSKVLRLDLQAPPDPAHTLQAQINDLTPYTTTPEPPVKAWLDALVEPKKRRKITPLPACEEEHV